MVHKRSKEAQQRRDTRHLLITYSYIDRERCEKIAMQPGFYMEERETIKPYGKEYRYYQPIEVERGEVLVDSRGLGSFQKVVEVNR